MVFFSHFRSIYCFVKCDNKTGPAVLSTTKKYMFCKSIKWYSHKTLAFIEAIFNDFSMDFPFYCLTSIEICYLKASLNSRRDGLTKVCDYTEENQFCFCWCCESTANTCTVFVCWGCAGSGTVIGSLPIGPVFRITSKIYIYTYRIVYIFCDSLMGHYPKIVCVCMWVECGCVLFSLSLSLTLSLVV